MNHKTWGNSAVIGTRIRMHFRQSALHTSRVLGILRSNRLRLLGTVCLVWPSHRRSAPNLLT